MNTYYILQRKPTLIICDQHQTPVINVINGDEALATRITTLLNNAEDIVTLLDLADQVDTYDESSIEAIQNHAQTFNAEINNGT